MGICIGTERRIVIVHVPHTGESGETYPTSNYQQNGQKLPGLYRVQGQYTQSGQHQGDGQYRQPGSHQQNGQKCQNQPDQYAQNGQYQSKQHQENGQKHQQQGPGQYQQNGQKYHQLPPQQLPQQPPSQHPPVPVIYDVYGQIISGQPPMPPSGIVPDKNAYARPERYNQMDCNKSYVGGSGEIGLRIGGGVRYKG